MTHRRQTVAMLAILALAAAVVAGFGSSVGSAKTTTAPLSTQLTTGTACR